MSSPACDATASPSPEDSIDESTIHLFYTGSLSIYWRDKATKTSDRKQ
jgi:hypothetical protein